MKYHLGKQKSKYIIGVVILAIVSWMYISATPKDTSPIILGFIAPLSGEAAVYGIPAQQTVGLAVSEINNAGGIDGRYVEVVYEDGGCNGIDAARAAQNLVADERIEVILGGFCSNETVSAEPITTDAKVLLFSSGASSPALTDISTYFARAYPSDASQGEVLADAAHAEGWQTVAFMQERLDYPLGIFRAFALRFAEHDGVVFSREFGTGDASPGLIIELEELRELNPDALFMDTQTSASAERIVNILSDMDWDVPLLLSDAVASDDVFLAEYPQALEGARAAVFSVDRENEVFQKLEKEYKALYGQLPYPGYMQVVYDSVHFIADGISNVGYDAEKLARWLRRIEGWQGASGVVDIGEDGDRVGGHQLHVVRGGILQRVDE